MCQETDNMQTGSLEALQSVSSNRKLQVQGGSLVNSVYRRTYTNSLQSLSQTEEEGVFPSSFSS